jgi:hypothetical protein
MNINWHNIRSINGDQKEGFEEFITQLARKEIIQNQCRFVRKGKPDAGVECFWILKDNSEWAWQAKYFTSSFGDSQWNQLDESIKTIIKKHKNVVKYFIAIPIDPPDARIDGQKSLLQRWDEHLQKWKGWAKVERLGNKIDFIPWWHSDLIERIQKPENSGFLLFWFDKELFTNDWFKNKIELSIANLGSRYTPEINFDLDIVKIFDGAARDSKFSKQLYEKLDDLLISLKKSIPSYEDSELSNQLDKLSHCCDFLNQEYIDIISIEDKQYDFKKLESQINEISTILNNIANRIDELIIKVDKGDKERLDHSKYYIRSTYSPIRDFESFINSTTVKLFNKPYLLLDGEAGIGKSHLLADIANIRIKEDKYSLLLLGQHFNNTQNPQKQILDQLDLNCKFDEFLEALNCKAQISGTRLIIFIDAINEGAGKFFWPDHFNGFIKNISKYSWIGLVFSIRSSYLKLLEDNIKHLSNELIKHTHYGFRNVEYEASKLFFKNYNIELPSVPLLHPEFQNPLFLKIFCDGLNKAGYTKIPDGVNGITKIFDFFIDSINIKLSSPKYFNYSSGVNIVKKVMHQLTKYKFINDLYYIPIENAVINIGDIQNTYNISGNLTDALISEGILSKNLFWKEKGSYEEGIYISYERFEDHLVVSEIINDISNDEITKAFEDEGLLFNFVKDEYAINRNKGIIEALSIQLPEKYGIELYELVNDKNNYEIAESFVSSLLWRKNELIIKNQIIDYINNTVLKLQGTHDYFWDTVIAVSTNPNHFCNANKTHEILSRYSLSDRDAWWAQLIHNWYNDDKSVKRLIDWAWSIEDKSHISDESIELASIMISWFLTSTNRRLRDSATKALICILENRIHIVIKLLRKFESVNDPYVYERIFAVAYGCTLRTIKTGNLKELSEYIYETIFHKDRIYPHVLLRDYARNIIEYTLYLGIELNIETKKIRPPYKSDFPPIPHDNEIKKYKIDYNSSDFKDYYWSINSLLSSMEVEHSRDGKVAMYGDFGRYIFQSKFHDWEQLNPVDLKNIAINRIIDLGYDVEKHGEFDRNIAYQDRHYVATERIGKKYQWIVMHELLAQVSDNYKMKAPWSWGEDMEMVDFCGPWEPYTRDIDPSTINKINNNAILNIQPNIEYNNWGIDNKLWLKDVLDLPEPKIIIEDNSKEWVMLEGHFDLTEDKLLGNERYSISQKQFWYQIKSYLVPTDQYENISEWLLDKNFMNGWMPESHDRYEIFNREYYWSPAYNYFNKEYYSGEQKRKIIDRENDKEIGDVIVTTDSYLWEAQYDLSKEEAFRLLKPCSKLVEGLELSYRNNESYMYLGNGELICFDNSEGNSGHSCFYFKKSVLQDFLEKHDYKIIWTVLGEKNIIGGHGQDNYGRWPIVSGVYIMENNEISGRLNRYE